MISVPEEIGNEFRGCLALCGGEPRQAVRDLRVQSQDHLQLRVRVSVALLAEPRERLPRKLDAILKGCRCELALAISDWYAADAT